MGKALAGRMGHEAAQAPAPALCLCGRLELPEDRSKRQLQAHRPSDVAAEDAERSENQMDQGDQGRANKRQSLGSPLPEKMVKQAWHLADHGLHHFGGCLAGNCQCCPAGDALLSCDGSTELRRENLPCKREAAAHPRYLFRAAIGRPAAGAGGWGGICADDAPCGAPGAAGPEHEGRPEPA